MPGSPAVPVLLLKTRSTPTDHYEDLFAAAENHYQPTFLAVLEHRFRAETISWLKHVLLSHAFAANADSSRDLGALQPDRYAGFIFTSQRSVEAFASVVESVPIADRDVLLPPSLPIYVVGPATARAVRAMGIRCQVLGEEAGNGQALAAFVLQHHNTLPAAQTTVDNTKLPLLFLVGEQRRDIIPKTLQSSALAEAARIPVDERVVYETGEMTSFGSILSDTIDNHVRQGLKQQWIVVFSPQGCRAMLRCLGWLDDHTGRFNARLIKNEPLTTFIATIGPTTRDYLVSEFGFEPHVCAEKPSPDGIISAIRSYSPKR